MDEEQIQKALRNEGKITEVILHRLMSGDLHVERDFDEDVAQEDRDEFAAIVENRGSTIEDFCNDELLFATIYQAYEEFRSDREGDMTWRLAKLGQRLIHNWMIEQHGIDGDFVQCDEILAEWRVDVQKEVGFND